MNSPATCRAGFVGTDLAIRTADDFADYFATWDLAISQREYLVYQLKRYEHLLAQIERALTGRIDDSGEVRLLDIGPGFQTELLRARYSGIAIDSLGYASPDFPPRPFERHLDFDLNLARDRANWPSIGEYDLVIMAEVVEHLAVSATTVLACIRTWMKPGGILIVQTPNAAALHKRLKLLVGKHPYGPASDAGRAALHFREYTLAELLAAGRASTLPVVSYGVENYWNTRTPLARVYNRIAPLLPETLRHGITVVYERPLAVSQVSES